MNPPVKFWQNHKSWDEADQAWDERAKKLAETSPLKTFKKNPNLPGIRKKTRKYLPWKTLAYLHDHDYSGKLEKHFWKHPIKHGLGLLGSLLKSENYKRDGDFFIYGLEDLNDFETKLKAPKTVLVAGFSYCHKPFECPAGRFTDACSHDIDHPVCGQCFIGKCVHSLPETQVVPLFITTVHYIGEQMLEAQKNWPKHDIFFLITACELTLEMFSNIGVAVDMRGIGVRLDGQICNTMRAFEASEFGVKPGMAIVTDETQGRMMSLLKIFAETSATCHSTPQKKPDNIIATDAPN